MLKTNKHTDRHHYYYIPLVNAGVKLGYNITILALNCCLVFFMKNFLLFTHYYIRLHSFSHSHKFMSHTRTQKAQIKQIKILTIVSLQTVSNYNHYFIMYELPWVLDKNLSIYYYLTIIYKFTYSVQLTIQFGL